MGHHAAAHADEVVDDDTHPASPIGYLEPLLETVDRGVYLRPALALGDERLQADPVVERHLDRVFGATFLEQVDHIAAEKGSVHAEFDGESIAEAAADLAEQRAEEPE